MGIFDKVLAFVGVESEGDYDDGPEEFLPQSRVEQERSRVEYLGDRKSKVVNIHTTAQLKLVVMQPETFDEARDIAEHLKTKKPVVINLEGVDRESARRIIDFLSGSVFALDGNIQKVSNGIFLIAPYNVGIMGDFKDELRNKGVFAGVTNWF